MLARQIIFTGALFLWVKLYSLFSFSLDRRDAAILKYFLMSKLSHISCLLCPKEILSADFLGER